MAMYEWFGLNPVAKAEMRNLDSYKMNIFRLRDETQDNELISVLMITMSKRGILHDVHELDVEALTRFMQLI